MNKCKLIVTKDDQSRIVSIVAAYADKDIDRGQQDFDFMALLPMQEGVIAEYIEVPVRKKQKKQKTEKASIAPKDKEVNGKKNADKKNARKKVNEAMNGHEIEVKDPIGAEEIEVD